MLVVNASNSDKDYKWICIHNNYKAEVNNITKKQAILSVQGPDSLDLLQSLTDLNIKQINYYSFVVTKFANCDNILISRTGYTGCLGYELYMKQDYAQKIWNSLFLDKNLEPIGLAARDTLRLEMGYCLYGNDIHEKYTPIEAGLSWIVKMNSDFIGKNLTKTIKRRGGQIFSWLYFTR